MAAARTIKRVPHGRQAEERAPRSRRNEPGQTNAPIVPAGSVTGRSLTLVITIMCFLACLTAGAVYMMNQSASALAARYRQRGHRADRGEEPHGRRQVRRRRHALPVAAARASSPRVRSAVADSASCSSLGSARPMH
jgi:hypothetical protein